MDADRIVRLTPAAVEELLDAHRMPSVAKQANVKRRHERWPFPGTIEIWLPEKCYGELNFLATLHNLSPGGLAMRSRRPIPVDTRLSFAIHVPALSTYGEGVVRHCTQAHAGYLIGVEFIFEATEQGS